MVRGAQCRTQQRSFLPLANVDDALYWDLYSRINECFHGDTNLAPLFSRKPTVLVVDDQAEMAETIADGLRDRGWVATPVASMACTTPGSAN